MGTKEVLQIQGWRAHDNELREMQVAIHED